ncbi:MAG: universal stress protein [Bacteroidia bacterium]|nr:universal stress protein [Bacteroidia bacterium]
MKKILIPFDFSENAGNALRLAHFIAQRSGGEVVLVNVVEYAPGISPGKEGADAPGVEAEYLGHLFDTLEAHLNKTVSLLRSDQIPVSLKVEAGNVVKILLKLANELACDLIIMGAQGQDRSEEFFTESKNERILRLARVPVLTVRNLKEPFGIKRIVFATDLQLDQKVPLEKIRVFQSLFEAELYLLYINTPNNFMASREIFQQAQQLAAQAQLQDYHLHIESDYSEEMGIMHFAETLDADMVSLATRQRRGLAYFFTGSLTEKIVTHAQRPILAFGMKYGSPI